MQERMPFCFICVALIEVDRNLLKFSVKSEGAKFQYLVKNPNIFKSNKL
jgi:hypothetical protein